MFGHGPFQTPVGRDRIGDLHSGKCPRMCSNNAVPRAIKAPFRGGRETDDRPERFPVSGPLPRPNDATLWSLLQVHSSRGHYRWFLGRCQVNHCYRPIGPPCSRDPASPSVAPSRATATHLARTHRPRRSAPRARPPSHLCHQSHSDASLGYSLHLATASGWWNSSDECGSSQHLCWLRASAR